jgi:transposase-like protein
MMDAKDVALMTDVPDEVQRWTARRKAAVVMSIVKGETSAVEAARKHGLTVAEIERWKEQFFAAGENALQVCLGDEEAAEDEQISHLQKKVGELVLDIDILREANKGRAFGPGTQDESSRRSQTSPGGASRAPVRRYAAFCPALCNWVEPRMTDMRGEIVSLVAQSALAAPDAEALQATIRGIAERSFMGGQDPKPLIADSRHLDTDSAASRSPIPVRRSPSVSP